jgi:putative superfamily III holin-X
MQEPYMTEEELRELPVGELLSRLARDLGLLVRQEADLARAEVREKAREAGPGAGMLGAASGVALLAGGALTACAILALNIVLDAWAAALIVALVEGAIALFLFVEGRNRIKAAMPPVPEQTVETVKEDVEWAKNQARSVRR